jgi:hypothetical protein
VNGPSERTSIAERVNGGGLMEGASDKFRTWHLSEGTARSLARLGTIRFQAMFRRQHQSRLASGGTYKQASLDVLV